MGVSAAAIGAALTLAVLDRNETAAASGRRLRSGPKAVVDRSPWDMGVIESGAEFGHTFLIRNEGDRPLELARGRSLCACTVTDLPEEAVPPGEMAQVRVGFTDSVKNDPLKPGAFSRGVHILTNDPDRPDILLGITATVSRRVAAAPSPITLAVDSSQPAEHQGRSAETLIYSERWDGFDLSVGKTSLAGIQCCIEPASEKELKDVHALCGYRVVVTLPPEMADGRFDESIECVAEPSASEGPPQTLQVPIRGVVSGRLTFHGAKIVRDNVLYVGSVRCGRCDRATVLMKVKDECRNLNVEQIDVEPPFLRVRVAPYAAASRSVGLYEVEVEIPDDAPSCAFTGSRAGFVRLKTDHPRLPVIELKVDFAVLNETLAYK